MKIVKGDIIKMAIAGDFDVILHGCNCYLNFGAGLAKQIKEQLPEAYAADLKTIKGDKSKLGTYSSAIIKRGDVEFTVLNGYSQYQFGWGGPHVDYNAIQTMFNSIKKEYPGKRIAYPMIGAGLAGGDWNKIYTIIRNELVGENHALVEFKQ